MKVIDREWVSKAPKLRRVAPFDGVRGIGVLGVMAGHSFGEHSLSFSAIVDLFFVVSGFLITTLLLQEHRSTGRVALKKFYARRSLRLLPLLYVVLLVNGIVGVTFKLTGLLEDTPWSMSGLVKETLGAGTYIYNLLFPTLDGMWMAHMWTLSVEEQFYLVVGVTMLVVLHRGGIRAFTWALAGLTLLIQVSRLFFLLGPSPLGSIAVATTLQRPDSLMVGMLAALINANIADPISPRAQRFIKGLGWAGVVAIFVAVWTSTTWFRTITGIDITYLPDSDSLRHAVDAGVGRYSDGHVYWVQWGSTLAAWGFVGITLASFRTPDWWPNKLTSWAPLAWIGGSLSYGLYIWHYYIQHYIRILTGNTGSVDSRLPVPFVVQLALDVAVPFLIAVPSYYLVERKALEIKNRFSVERPIDQPRGPRLRRRSRGEVSVGEP